MKKFFKSAMLFAAAAMAFTACSDDDTTEVMPQDEGVRFNIEANIESQTRVEVTGDGGMMTWVPNDNILLQYNAQSDNALIRRTFRYTEQGVFELNIGGTIPTPKVDTMYVTAPSTEYDKKAFAIKAKQTNSYSAEKGFNFNHAPLIAAPFKFEQSMMNGNEVNLSLAMRHVASYIQIRFVTEKAEYKNLEVASVMFEDKQGKAVAGQLDRSMGSMDGVPASGDFSMAMNSSSMDVTVDFETNHPTVADKTATADRNNVAYMVVYPGEYYGKFTVKTTDGKTFEIVAPKAKTFARGTVNRIALNLKNHTEGEVVEQPVKILGVNPERIDFASAAAQSQDVVVSVEHFNGLKHKWNLIGSKSFTFTEHAGQFTWTVNATENTTYQDRNEEVKIQILDEQSTVLQEVVIPVTQKAKVITGPAYQELTDMSQLKSYYKVVLTSADAMNLLTYPLAEDLINNGHTLTQNSEYYFENKHFETTIASNGKIAEDQIPATAVLTAINRNGKFVFQSADGFLLRLNGGNFPRANWSGYGLDPQAGNLADKYLHDVSVAGSVVTITNNAFTAATLTCNGGAWGIGSADVRMFWMEAEAPVIPASASVTPTEFNFAQTGGEQEFVVTIKNKKADKSYAWTASAVDHFSAVNTTNGVKVTAPENTTTSQKSATMKITVTENGAVLLVQDITLTQDAKAETVAGASYKKAAAGYTPKAGDKFIIVNATPMDGQNPYYRVSSYRDGYAFNGAAVTVQNGAIAYDSSMEYFELEAVTNGFYLKFHQADGTQKYVKCYGGDVLLVDSVDALPKYFTFTATVDFESRIKLCNSKYNKGFQFRSKFTDFPTQGITAVPNVVAYLYTE